MNKAQIESWALHVIDTVVAGYPSEDARVELKREWPTDIPRAARRLAGHANTARGDPILWLVGVDQTAGVIGANHTDLATWWRQMQAQFDGVAPDLVDVNVPAPGGVTVAALYFETDRSPFVVLNPAFGTPGGGAIQREVPWREGTAIRSAYRSDLIRLLVPLQKLPSVKLLGAGVDVRPERHYTDEPQLSWTVSLELYVIPRTKERIIIPMHDCEGSFGVEAVFTNMPLTELRVHPPTEYRGIKSRNLSLTIRGTEHEVLIDGPGILIVEAEVTTPVHMDTLDGSGNVVSAIVGSHDAQIHVRLLPVDAEQAISLDVALKRESLYMPPWEAVLAPESRDPEQEAPPLRSISWVFV